MFGFASAGLTRNWREQDGAIYFSVTSNGMTGEQWISRLEATGFQIGDYAKSILRSPSFKPTKGVTTEVAVLKYPLFGDGYLFTEGIRAFAAERQLTRSGGLTTPNAEVACLIREALPDEEIEAMGLVQIVVMHGPVDDSDGTPSLLGVARNDAGRHLDAFLASPGFGWPVTSGFAFLVLPDRND